MGAIGAIAGAVGGSGGGGIIGGALSGILGKKGDKEEGGPPNPMELLSTVLNMGKGE